MSNALTRLALLQFTAVLYCFLAVATMLKMRISVDGPQPTAMLATNLRDYGAWLFLVPTVWCIWGALSIHRPRAEAGDAETVFAAGQVLLVAFIILAFLGTMSVWMHNSLVHQLPKPSTPTPLRSVHQVKPAPSVVITPSPVHQ